MSREITYQILDILKAVGIERLYGIPGDTIDTMVAAISHGVYQEIIAK